MSNRFAHLSVEGRGAEIACSSDSLEATPSSTKATIKQAKKNIRKSANFTWKVLSEQSLNQTSPHGLANRSNFCYLNAVLQPLLLCQPFVNIAGNLCERVDATRMKWLGAFGRLIQEFSPTHPKLVNPDYLYKCWEHSEDQEDAEEFLRLILNGLHDELLKYKPDLKWTLPSLQNSVSEVTVEKEWLSVGPKQRISTSRSLIEPESPISCIFNGRFKSVVKGAGSKDSVTSEPFQFLSVDLVHDTLYECILQISEPEKLSSKLQRQLSIEKLPPILIVQLKRFLFDSQSGQFSKSFKPLNIPKELDLSSITTEWSDSVFFTHVEKPVYGLFAVVYHMGRFMHGGHYTCHVKHMGEWCYCDDSSCTARSDGDQVGSIERNRTPYLLFYERIKM